MCNLIAIGSTLLFPEYMTGCNCVVRRQGTLSSLAIRSVRYGGPVEAALAARVLGLLSLTLGAGDDSER